MKKKNLTVVSGSKSTDELIRQQSDELLYALLVNNDREEAENIIKELDRRGDLVLVSKQQEKDS